MATKKKSVNTWRFESALDLVVWMEGEALNEITLEDVDPPPGDGAAPQSVSFTWALHGTGATNVVPYTVQAEGVTAWTLEGTRDDHAISVIAGNDTDEGGDGGEEAGVHLILEVPGRLTLRCRSLTITRQRARKKPAPQRPHTAYAYFLVAGPRDPTVADVVSALGAPPGAELAVTPPSVSVTDVLRPRAPTLIEVRVNGTAWIVVHNMNPRGDPGYSLSVSRKGASDEEWRRAQELPRLLGPSRVGSAWEFNGTDEEWSALLARADEEA